MSPGVAAAATGEPIAAQVDWPGLAALLGEVGDLKRVRAPHLPDSVAGTRFARAWARLVAGEAPAAVARREAAAAVAGARLGAIDLARLEALGEAPAPVLERAFDAVAAPLGPAGAAALRPALLDAAPANGDALASPAWVRALAGQPRAGATAPGRPRVMLLPEESHAEHCWTVAVGAVLVAGAQGADPVAPFLCGLAHHLHNARLPDAGWAGERLLGDRLEPLLERLTEAALAELPGPLQAAVRRALALRDGAEGLEAQAFHAADVLDRVLEMAHHARSAAFTVEQALDELELVHAGPTQAFGLEVLAAAGLP